MMQMIKYNPKTIELKWQKKWYSSDAFRANNFSKKKKFYLLVEFPYPSADGLHVGHCRSYTALDIIARKKRMQGFNVLYPMGWDAFGLPAENYAIKKGVHPLIITKKNTDNFRKQMKSLGLSFDWSREINTTDPKYYKWTQWIFIKLFENGLAYKDKININWCPSCKTGLANEEVISGNCERCGTKVEKREKEQWLIKITKYADRLIKDLDLVDYPERVKIQQKEWIGRSEGAEIEFQVIKLSSYQVRVFTTRPDTIFGCTFLVVAPEHSILEKLKSEITNWEEVEKYINQSKNKSDLQRQEQKEKNGVELKGVKAINPANKKEIPIFIADYVMVNYGTGAIMAVPAHDERDFEFAKKYNIPIKEVILQSFGQKRKDAVYRNSVTLIITRSADNKVLILYNRATKEYKIPGGGHDGEEDDVATLTREIKEESGYVDFEIKEYLGQIETNFFAIRRNIYRVKHQKAYHVVLLSEKTIDLQLNVEEDFEHQWVFPEEAIKKLDSDKNIAYESEFIKRYLQPNLFCFSGQGELVNSEKFNGIESEKAKAVITEFVGGKKTVNYKLRDWIFSRQHYWGEPIPMINCAKCGWTPVPEKDLPVELPKVKKYQPTDTGESPLSAIEKFVNVKCPKCKGEAKRETDTMPNWAGSNWYYLAYTAPNISNFKFQISNFAKGFEQWMPVDWYNGGMEHTTLHLLYSRFIFKFLWDIGAVPKQIGSEPYKKRTSHGMILGEGGVKMSKSIGNVVNPDDVVKKYGADTLRIYEMFIGPFEQAIPWDEKGIIGARRFLEKIYKLALNTQFPISNFQLKVLLNKTIKKVSEDIELMKFNTAVSSLMTFVNEWSVDSQGLDRKDLVKFLTILSPFAPHLAEELCLTSGVKQIKDQKWPEYDEKLIKEEKVLLIIQINGKVRDKIEVSAGINQKEAERIIFESSKINNWIEGKKIVKIIFVPDKLINIVI